VSESRDEQSPNGEGDESEQELPPFDFNLLVLSLTTSALIHLGEAPDADGPKAGEVNLGLARQVIDTVAVLDEKTRGNLTGEEERILHQALFDLRMRYARKASGK
jgi:hypothetical protein